jgi:hypothetical protein
MSILRQSEQWPHRTRRLAQAADEYAQWKAEHGEEADREGTRGINQYFPSWAQKKWLHEQDIIQRKLDSHL